MAKNYVRSKYDKKDSMSGFVYGGIIAPILFSALIVLVITLIANSLNQTTEQITGWMPILILTLLVAQIAFISWLVWYNRKKGIDAKKALNFHKVDWRIVVIVAVLGASVLLLSNNFLILIDEGLRAIGYVKSGELPWAIDSIGNLALGLLVLAVIPAFVEEVFFRGVIVGGMLNSARSRKAKIIAIIVGAVIFALIHSSVIQLFYPLMMGVVFGFVYYLTGNLWYSMILHFCSNGGVVVFNYIASLQGVVASAPVINLEFAAIAVVELLAAVILIVGALFLIRKLGASKSCFVGEKDDEAETVEVIMNESGRTDEEVLLEIANLGADDSLTKEQMLVLSRRQENLRESARISNNPKAMFVMGISLSIIFLILDFFTYFSL